ncbi:hypothetical protein ACH4TX_11710 [Streptomyces sp. NPDC021098]|uniref:hypothetical protein n=1 Tax=unclassified Streptomyces TaxID=2593676 RepID=UPI003790D7E2
MNREEVQALLDLVNLEGRVDDLIPAARSVSRGHIDEVVIFGRASAINAVRKCISGEITGPEFTEWAEAIHSLDPIGVDEEYEDLLLQFLFEISTPELFFAIDAETCAKWADRLRKGA